MSIHIPPPPPAGPGVQLVATDPADGCAVENCGEFKTVQLHPYRGRLCPSHAVLPTLPDGSYRADFAEHLVTEYQRADTAFCYLAAWLAREIDRRFYRGIDDLVVGW